MTEADASNPIPAPHKTLRWWDGVAITLSLPAALFISLGTSIGALGAWAAIALWAVIAAVAVLHNWIYSEMGAMFGDKSGGIALYANEAWRYRYPSLLGPLATYAYWFSWATAPAIWGLAIGQILKDQFWPNATASLNLGLIRVDVLQLVALGVAAICWALSMIQMRFTMVVLTVAGVLLTIPALIFAGSPFLASHWSTSTFTWRIGGGWQGARSVLAWFFLMAWSSYGIETAASFIPEFRDTVPDTRKALRISALLLLLVFTVAPLGIAGLVGERTMGNFPNGFLQVGADMLVRGGAVAMTLVLVAGVLMLSIMGSADAGRALYQSSREGLTIRQFGVLNEAGVPARAVTLQFAINVGMVLFFGNALAVIVASNVGYILAHLLAVSGFLVLRKDQPDALRPIRLTDVWVPIAVFLTVFDALILFVGAASTAVTGYGGVREIAIAIGVLAISQVLYWLRRLQDGSKHAADSVAAQ